MEENKNLITLERLLYQKNMRDREAEDGCDGIEYKDILEKIMMLITDNHSTELAAVLYDKAAEQRLRSLINKYLIQEKLITSADIHNLSSKIYEDMAGISYVKKYLDDPAVEEININGPYGTWIVYQDKKILTDEKFSFSGECVNIIKKMARMGNLHLDGADPVGDSFLKKGVRMSAAVMPVVGEETGGICSIRKQRPAYITREKLIKLGTASEDELEFLSLCVNNDISVAIAGSTGAGKTADINCLLSTISDDVRIYSIEDTKELQIEKYDAEGRKINDVVQLYTKEPPHPVTMADLVKLSLRFHPKIIVPAEMRGKEAKDAVELGRTGHTIISSLHANSCKGAYKRILTMYLMAGSPLSEDLILEMIVEAFPIILFKRQLPDGSRKYIEIFEATGIKGKRVLGRSLFKYVTKGVEREGGRVIKINGEHRQVGSISEKLAEKLRINGVEQSVIDKFYFDGPEVMGQ